MNEIREWNGVLLVDDNSLFASHVCGLFKALGLTIEHAVDLASARDSFAHFKTIGLKVVVLDYQLQVKQAQASETGDWLIGELKAHFKQAPPELMMVTAYGHMVSKNINIPIYPKGDGPEGRETIQQAILAAMHRWLAMHRPNDASDFRRDFTF